MCCSRGVPRVERWARDARQLGAAPAPNKDAAYNSKHASAARVHDFSCLCVGSQLGFATASGLAGSIVWEVWPALGKVTPCGALMHQTHMPFVRAQPAFWCESGAATLKTCWS
jgi:hypothetical protein